MNWNGQREYLNHLIQRRLEPQKSAALQKEFDAKRMQKIIGSLTTRPVYLPLEFEMTAAGQTSAYRDTTQSQAFDVIVVGIKAAFTADNPVRDIVIRRTEEEKPMAYFGDELNLYLSSDEIAGSASTIGNGQTGVFYMPSPVLLPAGNRLTVEVYKTDVTPDPEQANIVLIGLRVFKREYGELMLDQAERQQIEFLIRAREVPQVKFLKQAVSFDSAVVGGVARNLYTPQVEEPLLIRGVRSTLRHSEMVVRIQGEPNWTVLPTPCWAIAGENDLGHENYQWFPKPIYLHSRSSIEIESITNGFDGNLDNQTGNSITWLCETV